MRHALVRRVWVAAIVLAGLLGLPQVGATGGELLRAARAWIAEADQIAATLRTPGAGEQVLGPMGEAVVLLRAQGIEAYRASPGVAGDELALQRLTEGAWPVRPRADARWVVSFLDEPNDCEVVAERQLPGFGRRGVRLARCP